PVRHGPAGRMGLNEGRTIGAATATSADTAAGATGPIERRARGASVRARRATDATSPTVSDSACRRPMTAARSARPGATADPDRTVSGARTSGGAGAPTGATSTGATSTGATPTGAGT